MSESEHKNYNILSDEQLAELIKSGEYECFSILLGRYAGYIKTIAAKFEPSSEREDLISEGFLELFKAAVSYSADKGTKFKTFATLCVKDAILRHLHKATAKKRIPDSMLSSIEDIDIIDSDSPESLIIKRENIKSFFDTAKSKLSAFEYTVFCSYIFGNSYKEIATATGKSIRAVDGALTRARNKLKGQ